MMSQVVELKMQNTESRIHVSLETLEQCSLNLAQKCAS